MPNTTADFPENIHSPTDTSEFANSNLGETNPTHTQLEGKQEEEIVAIQTELGVNTKTITEATTPTATPTSVAEYLDMVATQLKAIIGGTHWYTPISSTLATLVSHLADLANPHAVTATHVGLGNVDNTSDSNKPVSTAMQTALDDKVDEVLGMGLSSNDFTDSEQLKLSGIEEGANDYSLPTATDLILGGIKVGARLSIANGVLSADVQTTDITGKASLALDNLASVAINSSLLFDTDSIYDIGDTTHYVANIFSDKIYLNSTASLDGSGAGTVTLTGTLTALATSIITDTTTGLKIGTGTTQKLGFFNATPVVQPTATTTLGTVLSNLGLRAAGTAFPISTSGAVSFTGTHTTHSMTFSADSTYDIGTTSVYARNIFLDKLTLNSTASLDGATAGRIIVTGQVYSSNNLADAYAWETGGTAFIAAPNSPYNKYQAALRGLITNTYYSGDRTNIMIGLDFGWWQGSGHNASQLVANWVSNHISGASTITNGYGFSQELNFWDEAGQSIESYIPYGFSGITRQDGSANAVTITNWYQFHMPTISATNLTITNKWGVYIEDTTAKNYFGGQVQFGNAISTIEYTTDHMSINKGAGGGVYLFEGAAIGEVPVLRIYGYGTEESLSYGEFGFADYGELEYSGTTMYFTTDLRTSYGIHFGQYVADNVSAVFGAGADSSIYFDGTDLVINSALVGTGVLKFINATNWTANGTANVTISNVAPAGVGTATISKWFTVKDSGGTVYYLPAWT